MIAISTHPRQYPLKRAFKISRATKHYADVVEVELRMGKASGRGECVPYSRYNETQSSVIEQIQSLQLPASITDAFVVLDKMLPPGAAKNAVNCALWALWAETEQCPLTKLPPLVERLPKPFVYPDCIQTCRTISVDSIDAMTQETHALGQPKWLKVKLDAHDITAKIKQIHQISPNSILVIDANEAWSIELLNEVIPELESLPIVLIEQPIPAGMDEQLVHYAGSIPICADESCHTHEDIKRLAHLYQAFNIKLDKSGGLSEAIKMVHTCRTLEKDIMLGCMVGTSLAMAPSVLLSTYASVIDLDGPALLAEDSAPYFQINGSDFYT
ncbi:MAG: dipeptide epimerase [Alteromonadaceae bacterium]|nr:dipeptide epimerase [Alteromonadaceae bacterium]